MKSPREVIEEWVAAFNARDGARAAVLYHEDATNWQVAAGPPLIGHANIKDDLTTFFAAFPDSVTPVENLFEAGEWAILEWSGGATWRGEFASMPPNSRTFSLRGCGFFHVVHGKIKYQRGYWDRATWFKQLGIPVYYGRSQMNYPAASCGVSEERDDHYPKAVTPECLYRGSSPNSPYIGVSRVEPPLKACGNDGLRKEN